MAVRRVDYKGVPYGVAPGGVVITPDKPRGQVNQGSGTPVVTPTVDNDYGSIMLKPIDSDAVHTNVAGSATSTVSLTLTAPNITTNGIAYPGGAADDNNTQWEVPVPFNFDDTAEVRVRVHILIPT